MKNIQIIDGAINCVYDIFQISDAGFDLIFTESTDIAFIEDLEIRDNWSEIIPHLSKMWSCRVLKKDVNGIHGTLFYQLIEKKKYYPSLKDEEAVNPTGSNLRAK